MLSFFDAHIEFTQGWLEPLLARIANDRSAVVCPQIDKLDVNDFSYKPSKLTWIGFHWLLNMDW